ncbi:MULTISPECIES: hypothetical protein [unclassified Enterococcus]|uniref:hypothetical protein n=1 Tax=unclassified Enterococcus TaxID=2608891 RepID=UPI0013EBFEFF|nr:MULTISPECIES: hypothetical protein [unclassified Enterococcus]
MKPIDFPEKYENLMRVAQQALAKQQYGQARELLQRAYELNETFEANSLLVFCLYELDEKKEALRQAILHEPQYLSTEEFAGFYFDLLIGVKDYLYARKLIASADFSDSFEQTLIEKIQYAEELSGQMERQKIRGIYQTIEKLPFAEPAQQLLLLNEVEQLPYHEFIQAVKKLIVTPEIHLLARARLLESLVQVKECTKFAYLTIEEKLIDVIPKKLPRPEEQKAFQELCQLADQYENQDAMLGASLKEEFAMQSALTYPIYDRYINHVEDWFELTIEAYGGIVREEKTEEQKEVFLEKRTKILAQLMKFQ